MSRIDTTLWRFLSVDFAEAGESDVIPPPPRVPAFAAETVPPKFEAEWFEKATEMLGGA